MCAVERHARHARRKPGTYSLRPHLLVYEALRYLYILIDMLVTYQLVRNKERGAAADAPPASNNESTERGGGGGGGANANGAGKRRPQVGLIH